MHPGPTAILICTMISIRTHSVRHTVSIGNRFPWLYITRDGCQKGRGEGGLHVSKERRDIKKGDEKRKGGLIHPS